LSELSRREQEAEAAKKAATVAIAHASMRALEVVLELLEDEDPNIRARAADLIWSRSIPKIAAKHLSHEDDGVIDSVDNQALRESILEMVKKNGR
jgi:hypothetical protein